jgi:hypothetical protein
MSRFVNEPSWELTGRDVRVCVDGVNPDQERIRWGLDLIDEPQEEETALDPGWLADCTI